MRVVIAGGSGFLGTALTGKLVADKHQVVILSRDPKTEDTDLVRYRHWDPNETRADLIATSFRL